MDNYNILLKFAYEKMISMAKLNIISVPKELYDLYGKWLGAFSINAKARLHQLELQIARKELQEYQSHLPNNDRFN